MVNLTAVLAEPQRLADRLENLEQLRLLGLGQVSEIKKELTEARAVVARAEGAIMETRLALSQHAAPAPVEDDDSEDDDSEDDDSEDEPAGLEPNVAYPSGGGWYLAVDGQTKFRGLAEVAAAGFVVADVQEE